MTTSAKKRPHQPDNAWQHVLQWVILFACAHTPMLTIGLYMQDLILTLREASLIVMLAICSNSGTLEHAGTNMSQCRIFIGSQEGQSQMILGRLDVSRIFF